MNDLELHTFSPKELAAVVGVSQSSIKRWVDAGHISVTRTAGGHRRISRSAALKFIRSKRMRVVRPDLLGIPDFANVDQPLESRSLSGEFLNSLLTSGNLTEVRRVVTAAFLSGTSAAALFDGPISDALARIGEIWKTDQRGVFIEHGATATFIEVVSQIAALSGSPADDAPLAIGGSPPHDPHILPSLMVSAVLREAGWRTMNMGPNTPVHALADACEVHQPDLVWIAIKSRLNSTDLEDLVGLCETLDASGIEVIVGGREVERTHAEWPETVRLLLTMTDLSSAASHVLAERTVRTM